MKTDDPAAAGNMAESRRGNRESFQLKFLGRKLAFALALIKIYLFLICTSCMIRLIVCYFNTMLPLAFRGTGRTIPKASPPGEVPGIGLRPATRTPTPCLLSVRLFRLPVVDIMVVLAAVVCSSLLFSLQKKKINNNKKKKK